MIPGKVGFHILDIPKQLKWGPFFCLEVHSKKNGERFWLKETSLHVPGFVLLLVAVFGFVLRGAECLKSPPHQALMEKTMPNHNISPT